MPLLSILIPSIPSRFDKAFKLYNHILSLVGDKDIEVLMFTDNKKRTIGAKREALKNISTGKYFMFTDDDDLLLSVEELYQAAQQDVDVITFNVECKNPDGSKYIITFGLGNEVEHNTKDGNYLDSKRPPFHLCAWNRDFRPIRYPDINYSEDWEWLKPALSFAKTETHIDKVLYQYNFNSAQSEASIESNEYWKNPNMLPEPKRAIVNLVTNNDAYIGAQNRLLESLSKYTKVDVFDFIGEEAVGAPPHKDNPYAFKIYAIEKLKLLGYNQILWLDASVFAVKDIKPVFDWLEEKEVFFEEAGHYAGFWAPKYVLKYFGISKQEADKMPMFSAGFCGIDFRKTTGQEFFAAWKESMLNGMFVGNWVESRHDMTCGSIIANKMGLFERYSKGGHFFSYIGPGYAKPAETSIFHLQGV